MLLVLAGSAGAQSASPAPAAEPGAAAAHRAEVITWWGAGAVYTAGPGTTAFGTTFGIAPRLRGPLAFSVDVTASYFTDDWLGVLRPGLTLFAEAPLAPFAGAHYALFRFAGDRWENGVGARVGLVPWRQRPRAHRHRFGLLAFVAYDHAFACSGGCDVWSPQAALTWEPDL
jgi:hypothetical protein